jgi:serine/threonine protein phosphatase PrpC
MYTSIVTTLHDNSAHGDDNFLVRSLGDTAFLDAVMDGISGRKGGEASHIVRDALAVASLTSPDDVLTALAEVNQQLFRRGRGLMLLTTLSAVLGLDDTLHVISAGDSPILLVRPDSHQALFSDVRGFLFAGVARGIGIGRRLGKLYRAEVKVTPGDRLIVATDGITDSIPPNALATLIRSATSPEDAAVQIRTRITSRYETADRSGPIDRFFRRDDWTAIIRFFTPAG